MRERLGDIVAADWRSRMSLALATEEDIETIGVRLFGESDDVVEDWHIVRLTVHSDRASDRSLRLLGRYSRGAPQAPFVSSDVVGIDLDAAFVLTTTGGLYGLGRRADGEPSEVAVAHMRHAMVDWGFGRCLSPAPGTEVGP
ncbi:hypothetical protein FW320_00420 [Azospirillum sp. Vi22]|uniref:hypothetical protein n=1 Tax=Azospirillum baldaniorum TaxID=1064539 RepID=UPI00157A7B9A|nr:hypothetical protein [Azospirillum baldaniorum]NUB04659.1 hypothetical protein [Azospirillum baldaniorum]